MSDMLSTSIFARESDKSDHGISLLIDTLADSLFHVSMDAVKIIGEFSKEPRIVSQLKFKARILNFNVADAENIHIIDGDGNVFVDGMRREPIEMDTFCGISCGSRTWKYSDTIGVEGDNLSLSELKDVQRVEEYDQILYVLRAKCIELYDFNGKLLGKINLLRFQATDFALDAFNVYVLIYTGRSVQIYDRNSLVCKDDFDIPNAYTQGLYLRNIAVLSTGDILVGCADRILQFKNRELVQTITICPCVHILKVFDDVLYVNDGNSITSLIV